MKGFFCNAKIEFTFFSEIAPIWPLRTVQSHEAKICKNNIDSLRSKVGGSRGRSETSQLELSLKSHAFQKFTDLGPVPNGTLNPHGLPLSLHFHDVMSL